MEVYNCQGETPVQPAEVPLPVQPSGGAPLPARAPSGGEGLHCLQGHLQEGRAPLPAGAPSGGEGSTACKGDLTSQEVQYLLGLVST